mgnify:CR=1 FL=1
MALAKNKYPIVGFRYEVSIIPEPQFSGTMANIASVATSASGADSASFSEISGISVSIETEEVKNGGDVSQEVPFERKFSPLVLKRGLSEAKSELVKWVTACMLSDVVEKNSTITKSIIVKLLSDTGEPLVYWVFVGAHPTKWSVSGLKAMSNELVIEEIELRYKFFYPVFVG